MFSLLKTESLPLFTGQQEGEGRSTNGSESAILAVTSHGVGEKIHLASCLPSSGDLTLYVIDTRHLQTPSVKKITWECSGYGQIRSLAFNTRGDQLAVICTHTLCLVPFTEFMKPGVEKSVKWEKKREVREVKLPSALHSVLPCSSVWWQTSLGKNVVIIGTQKGDVIFIDVEDKTCLHKTRVNGHITRFELVPDDSQHITYLLISGRSSLQWRLLLDIIDLDLQRTLPKERILALGYRFYGGNTYIKSILHSPADSDGQFLPHRFTNVPISVSLKYQSAKGCHLISAVDKTDTSLKIYDSSMEHHPLFVYNLPSWTEHLVYTDRLTFCALAHKHVIVLANQLSERDCNGDKRGHEILKYNLEEDETIQYMSSIKFPISWYNALVETSSNYDCASLTHTLLDGCLIITNRRVIQFVPELSAEQLFLNWCTSEHMHVERLECLAQVTHIDILNLYLRSANYLLQHGNVTQALDCLSHSKCDDLTKISMLHKYSQHELVIRTSRDILDYSAPPSFTSHADASTSSVSNTVLTSFLSVTEGDVQGSPYYTQFREFLLYEKNYSLDQAMRSLCRKGHIKLLLELALQRRFIQGAIEHVYTQQKLTSGILHQFILNREFVYALGSVLSGTVVYLLSTEDFCTYLLTAESITISNLRWLLVRLNEVEDLALQLLAQRYHPYSNFIHQTITSYREYLDVIGAQSYASLHQDVDEGDNSDKLSVGEFTAGLYLFYIKILLKLSTHLPHKCLLLPQLNSLAAVQKASSLETQGHGSLTLQCKQVCRPISCCSNKVYSIHRDAVFSWGSSTRLSKLSIEERVKVSTPSIASNLSNNQSEVKAISSGEKHLMILSSFGLQGCGSSVYGQVGAGFFQEYDTCVPVPVDCVDVVCGRYHTLALDTSGRVYSWGWGVFGQLGHGDIENQASPKLIEALNRVFISCIAAGHAHSIALSHIGEMYIFGSNSFGQVHSKFQMEKTCLPVIVQLSSPVTLVSTKYFHNIAVTKEKLVLTWGAHPYLAKKKVQTTKTTDSLFDGCNVAENLKGLRELNVGDCVDKIVQVECGTTHSLFLTETGAVYIYEDNVEGGQVLSGVNSSASQTTLRHVVNLPDISFISCDSGYSITLASDGSLYSWGVNHYGQLGLALRSIKETISPARVKLPQSYCVPSTQEMHKIRVTTTHPSYSVTSSPADPSLSEGLNLLEFSSLSLLEYFPLQHALSLSLQAKAYPAVVALFYSCNRWTESFFYHLKSLISCQKHVGEDYSTQVLKILNFYLRKLADVGAASEEILQLVYRVLQFWQAKQLPVRPGLEEILERHKELLSPALYHLLLSDTCQLPAPPDLIHEFSSSFLASLTRVVVQSIDKENGKNDTGVVWSGVVKTLRTGLVSRTSTTLTHFELNRLQTDSDSCSEVLVFTCGHNFTKHSLLTKILPGIEGRILGQLPISGTLLVHAYTSGECIAMACPQCVHSTVRTLCG